MGIPEGLTCSTLVAFRWSTAVDAQIGKSFGDFLVHDRHDLDLLMRMSKALGMKWLTIQVSLPSTPLIPSCHWHPVQYIRLYSPGSIIWGCRG